MDTQSIYINGRTLESISLGMLLDSLPMLYVLYQIVDGELTETLAKSPNSDDNWMVAVTLDKDPQSGFWQASYSDLLEGPCKSTPKEAVIAFIKEMYDNRLW